MFWLMNHTARISADTVSGLQLHEGDRVFGHVHDGFLELQVEAQKSRSTRMSGAQFVNKWGGKFRDNQVDLSNDPRAQAILDR